MNRSRELFAPRERYFMDVLQARLRGDNTGALWAARRVVEITPDYEVGLYELGVSALRVNRPQETVNALALYDFERELKGWVGSYDIFTQACHVLGNHREEFEVAQRGCRNYPELLSTLFYETRALAALGRVQEINQRLEESLTLPPQQEWTPGEVMQLTAAELREHDHRQAAFDVVARAINWYNNRPAEEAATPAHRYALARALYRTERWEEAQALMEKLAAEDSSNIDYQGYLGAIAARRGEPDKARRIAAPLQQLKRPYLFGRHTYWCACIAALLGEREQAVALLREAFAQGQAYGAGVLNDMNLESLRDYPPFKELLRPKG